MTGAAPPQAPSAAPPHTGSAPTGAISQSKFPTRRHPEFGTVFVNQNTCIGCGACVEACPYGVPHVNEETEKSRKCTGCFDRVANGPLPACVKTCPTRAIRYGEKAEMYTLAKARVKELQAQGWKSAAVYGLDQLGAILLAGVAATGLKKLGDRKNEQARSETTAKE